MGKKKISILMVILVCFFLIGCGSGKSFSEEHFGLTTNDQENGGDFVIALNIDKNMASVDYELSENGSTKETGSYEENDNGLLKEVVMSDKASGKYEYSFTVKDSDGNKLSKGLTITVADDSDSLDKENTSSTEKKDEKTKDTDISSESAWNGDSKEYQKDDKVSFNNKIYKCVQGHTSQSDWTPIGVASLWKEVK